MIRNVTLPGLYVPVVLLLCGCHAARLPSFDGDGAVAALAFSSASTNRPHRSASTADPVELSTGQNGDLIGPAVTEARAAIERLEGGDAAMATRAESLHGLLAAGLDTRVLLETLADQNGLALVLDTPLPSAIDLRGRGLRFDQLLDQIAEQSDAHWYLDGRQLHITRARRLTLNHAVDYLNVTRSLHSRVSLATQVGSLSLDGQSQAGNNSSETLLVNNAEQQPWQALTRALEHLRATLDSSASVTVLPESGVVSVTGSATLHREIARFIETSQMRSGAQVLIEATVVELTLSDQFKAGVDWQWLAAETEGVSAAQSLAGLPFPKTGGELTSVVPDALVSLVDRAAGGHIRATLQLLETFGDVRILSRPRIIALNNQPSVLKVVDNRVYFSLQVERRQEQEQQELITSTEIHTVPVGLVMAVTPQISASGDVMLNVRPSISRILGFVNDPNPALAQTSIQNSVPEVQVREMESMLRVRSGQLAVIGGLMQQSQHADVRGVAGLQKLPIVGHLFRHRSEQRQQTELLIVLRPVVLPAPLSPQRASLLVGAGRQYPSATEPGAWLNGSGANKALE